MAEYQTKRAVIEAKQWWPPSDERHDPSMLVDRKGNSVSPPDYLRIGDLYLAVPGGPPLGGENIFMLRSSVGDLRVRPGDWIVTTSSELKLVFNPETFATTFEPPTAAGAGQRESSDRTPMDRPRIVCLCGSTRFYDAFQRANYEETMAGRIVLSVGFYPHCQELAHGEQVACTSEQKLALDELHLRKIDLADEVLVLNVGGYIGSSTRGEIEHATRTGKPVRYLEPVATLSAFNVPAPERSWE